jgi:predicted nucleic acid-binding protein
MEYLLDSDWIIHVLGGRHQAIALLDQLTPQRVAVTSVTLGELYDGALGYANPQAHIEHIQRFLASYTILEPHDAVMQIFGELRSTLRRSGQLLPDFDLVIAATALYYDLTPLIFNRRHFERISDLRVYEPPPPR